MHGPRGDRRKIVGYSPSAHLTGQLLRMHLHGLQAPRSVLRYDSAEIRDRLAQSVFESDLGLPGQLFAGERNVGLALARVIRRKRLEDQLAARSGQLQD